MRYRNIILDWSGTLVDDFGPVLDATNEIFRHYSRPTMTADEFREKFFLPFPKFYEKYLPEATMVELEVHYHRSFHCLQENIQMLPHARDFLEFCRENKLRVFLLSTIHREHFAVQSKRLDIAHYFERPYVQILDKAAKIHEIMAENDLNPRETMFVGDMMHDIETAHHGGITGVAVLTGYDAVEKLKSVNPDLLFQNLQGLRHYLQSHPSLPDYFPIPTVGALIFNENDEVLMIYTHKWGNKWGIPGGKIKTDEPSVEALIREVREETNLEISDIRFTLVQDCIHSPEFYKRAHFILLNYTCRATSTEVSLNDEGLKYRWLSLAEAKKLDLNIPTRILIDCVEKNRKP
ncbi:MAG: NUDIX domain-containing protein [Verrucomicrobiae bacterium]|nr:NUDIX domain-containing protein [Verrucomicrobiae bacterium]